MPAPGPTRLERWLAAPLRWARASSLSDPLRIVVLGLLGHMAQISRSRSLRARRRSLEGNADERSRKRGSTWGP